MKVTWQETFQNMKADTKRRLMLEQQAVTLMNALIACLSKPGLLVVIIYRLSRFCYYNHLKFLCKLFSLATQLIDTSEISPLADIGGGFVVATGTVGIPAVSTIGKNCTFMGLNSITLGAMQDAPDANDRVVLGDYCVLGVYARVMRAVELANGTQVRPCSIVIGNVKKEGQTMLGVPARKKALIDYEDIESWNPLKGCLLEVEPK